MLASLLKQEGQLSTSVSDRRQGGIETKAGESGPLGGSKKPSAGPCPTPGSAGMCPSLEWGFTPGA